MTPPSCLVTVGYRKAAYEALDRMGKKALLVNPSPPPGRYRHMVAGWVSEDWRQPERLAQVLVDSCDPDEIAGVLALTEGSVEPAAFLRRSLGLPGISPEKAVLVRDKVAMKAFFRGKGIAVTDWLPIEKNTTAENLIDALGLPMVIKQRDSSGSRGLVIARDRQRVRSALRPGWMAERWIAGREMSIESFMADGRILFSNSTEYLEPLWANLVPFQMDEPQKILAGALNRATLSALGCPRGLAHLELFLTEKGAVLGEIALRPPGGHLMELLSLAYDFDPWEALVRLEMGEQPSLPPRHRRFAGMWLLHPGAGFIRGIEGVARARAVPGIAKLVIKAEPGSVLAPREGSGQEAGYLVATGESREAVVAALDRARQFIHFQMDEKPRNNRK